MSENLRVIQREIRAYKEELERKQMINCLEVVEWLVKWDKSIEDGLDDSKLRFEQLLIDKRKEYQLITGVKAFMGWGLAQVDARLEEWKENNRLIKENEEKLLTTKGGKGARAKAEQNGVKKQGNPRSTARANIKKK